MAPTDNPIPTPVLAAGLKGTSPKAWTVATPLSSMEALP